MIIQNKETKKEYPISKEKWDKLGKSQKIFIVVDGQDKHNVAQKVVSNLKSPEHKKEVEKNSEIKNVVQAAENINEEKKEESKSSKNGKNNNKK